jgi:integrase
VQQVLEWAYAELEKEVGEDRIMCPASVRRKLTSLRGLFSHAIRLDFITANPVAQVMNDNKALFDEGEGRDQWLRPDMEIRLRAALDAREARLRTSHAQIDSDARCDVAYGPDAAYVDHVKPAVLVALGTGLRRGEQMQLQWPDVDFDNERLRVRKATSKGDRTRYVPMCDEVIQVLKAWKAQTCSGPVQPILGGGALALAGFLLRRYANPALCPATRLASEPGHATRKRKPHHACNPRPFQADAIRLSRVHQYAPRPSTRLNRAL